MRKMPAHWEVYQSITTKKAATHGARYPSTWVFLEMFTCRCSTFLPKTKMLWKLIWPNSTNSSRLAILYIHMYISVCLLYLDYSILDSHSWSKCLFLCPHVNCNDSTSGANGVSWKVQCWSSCFNSRRLWGFRAHAQTLWGNWHHSST